MDIAAAAEIWRAYKAAPLIRDLHPDDHMWNTGQAWYWSVGESGIDAILRALVGAPTKSVQCVLDFGCGFGRVGRHLRSAFPDATLYFCELNEAAAAFCASTFNGVPVRSDALPKVDVIWVGSVFTHIDYAQTRSLFGTLCSALAPRGTLIATFHGRRAIEMAKDKPYVAADKWSRVLADFEATGAGFTSYAERTDYGVSLTRMAAIAELGQAVENVRFVGYREAGWSNHQDVAAWSHV